MAELWLVEHAAQVRVGPPRFRGPIIALSAEAMNALDTAGLPYRTPEQYLPTPQHTALGLALYDQVEAYTKAFDGWAHTWPALRATGLAPARLSFYPLIQLWSAIELRRAELVAILEAERPSRVWASPTWPEPIDHTLTFQRESAYRRVLESLDVRLAWVPCTRPRPPAKRAWTWTRLHQGFRTLRRRIHERRVTSSQTDRPSALLLHVTPDVAVVLRQPDPPYRWIRWAPPHVRVSIGPSPPDWPVPHPLYARRLAAFVRQSIPQMIRAAHQTDRVLARERMDIVWSGMPPATPEFRAIAARARIQGVPFVLMQHGGSYGYLDHPIHYWNDLALCDLWLAYGEGVIEGLRRQFGHRPLPQMVAVGSSALGDRVRESTRQGDASPPWCPRSSSSDPSRRAP